MLSSETIKQNTIISNTLSKVKSSNLTSNVKNIPEPTPGDEPFIGSKKTRNCDYLDFDNDEVRKKFFATNINNSVNKKENDYRGKYLKGSLYDGIEKEIFQSIGRDILTSVKFIVGRKPGKPEITARVVFNSNNKQPIDISSFLNTEIAKKYNITAFTLLLPDQDEKRGIRCRIDEDGTKIYEVANGSYEMNLKWYVEGMECNIKINLHDDGSVELVEHNSVTIEQLKVNKIKVGRQYEARPLHEVLAQHVERSSSETVINLDERNKATKTGMKDVAVQTADISQEKEHCVVKS
ncbi:hypothetical protein [Wolbachia endosymbiont of Chironomus riparius]|uniref:hypothetical protein n=1 Tax=Wolbachia endosymbiont of Chironomus riparius TaxID=2883238 RepID=UPI00209F85F5|nr:hypothetical protein [Wolbachia endosymbiont of Chironomus riparius]